MLKCRDVSQLASQERESPLRLPQRIGMAMHLAMCWRCRRFRQQIGLLGDMTRAYPGPPENNAESRPPERDGDAGPKPPSP
ncbi:MULTISPECIES: hypothetical protein [Achromobacter]|uniref:Zf-HC2 domain-containing protein n=1 Tax=Achromobacter spanius TaxID=217203 RepID=A0ABY8GNI5_9BURK|nr:MULTISPECIES: hypothetical protein [Achromobacter]WAI84537.1 hypothetical protein N8Z00_05525 [Achromobacter spanius]WEX94621.1 hypothetical protein N3Z32_00120 [Achromobacter sp. SS2-2022]WFP06215.1 hypothetical protein P8T11_17970 [Achromobacter spanius]